MNGKYAEGSLFFIAGVLLVLTPILSFFVLNFSTIDLATYFGGLILLYNPILFVVLQYLGWIIWVYNPLAIDLAQYFGWLVWLYNPYLLEFLRYFYGPILIVGIALQFITMSTLRRKGGVQKGKDYTKTTTLVESGIYSVVRHPQFLGWMLIYSAFIFLVPHPLIFIVGITGMVCVYLITRIEDKFNVEKFGEAYVHYMQSVPRVNFLVGLVRLLRR